jgi:hypothetical protein
LRDAGARGLAKPKANTVHVVLGPTADAIADALRRLLPAKA